MPAAAPLPLAMLRSGWVVRVGLDEGLLGRARAIAWADHWILALPVPPVELADVSMPGREVPWSAITAIGATETARTIGRDGRQLRKGRDGGAGSRDRSRPSGERPHR